MVSKEESRTIRIDQNVYDYIDTKADRASETFNEILIRLLGIKNNQTIENRGKD